MSTLIRPEISKRNEYWIPRHRYYELKHFCLQYREWIKIINSSDSKLPSTSCIECIGRVSGYSNPTEKIGMIRVAFNKIDMIHKAADEADLFLSPYIILAVTYDKTYEYIKTMMEAPCSRDTFYDRYRKFFWILSSIRG